VAPPESGVDDLWIDVVIPDATPDLLPLVDGESRGYEATSWGMRVPVGDLAAGAERRIAFVLARASPAPDPSSPGS
jgi:hypothetical protein